MTAVPALTPVTTPVVAFTVATEVLLLLHEPPAVPSLLYVVVDPGQIEAAPLTVPGLAAAFTVKVLSDDTGLPQPVLTV